MKASFVSAVSALAFAATASAANTEFLHLGRLVPPVEASEHADTLLASIAPGTSVTGSAFFNQLLDHDDTSKGTFQQKFWWNAEFWAGPGSPVGVQHEHYKVKLTRYRLFSSHLVKSLPGITEVT